MNCFLAGATHVFVLCNLSLSGDLPNVFWAGNKIAVLDVLGLDYYLDVVKSLKKYGISVLAGLSCDFGYICKHLLDPGLDSVNVYTDGSVKDLGSVGACRGAVVYFPDVNTSVGIRVDKLLFLTLIELQIIAFALKCVPISNIGNALVIFYKGTAPSFVNSYKKKEV
ncbi:hypothetical protein G9A89_022645 [Geosiphon pyriformis]|nr:hypothetical protein G9A89_022645 [Geosiphon pyriformis]